MIDNLFNDIVSTADVQSQMQDILTLKLADSRIL